MERQELAERVSSGLAGWFQQLAAQDLQEEVGEDAAKLELVRMIGAQRSFVPVSSKRPRNWPENTKRRIDIAILGRREGAEGWYGAIEVKWPSGAYDVGACRQAIVQDCIRMAFTETSNMNAKFVVVGGTTDALETLFDKEHPRAEAGEGQRRAFRDLFSRSLKAPRRRLANETLLEHFPDALARLPTGVAGDWNRRLATELQAYAHARVGAETKGRIYVWQCIK